MSLANLIKKGSLGRLATATPATPATRSPCSLSTVATVANVAVAIGTKKAANEPDGNLPGAENLQKLDGAAAPASSDPNRWCWPHSSAMNTAEINTFATRVHHFQQRRLTTLDAQKLADQLVNRDREGDDRHLCLECGNFCRAGAWRCSQWRQAGLGAKEVPAELMQQLQRCQAFKPALISG